MCGESDNNNRALRQARNQARAAQRRANQALVQARQAIRTARQTTAAPADSEAARKAAESVMRRRIASSTFANDYLAGSPVASSSVGYSMLSGS